MDISDFQNLFQQGLLASVRLLSHFKTASEIRNQGRTIRPGHRDVATDKDLRLFRAACSCLSSSISRPDSRYAVTSPVPRFTAAIEKK